MNAGAYGGEMKDVLKEVTVMNQDGEILTIPADKLELGYRTSIIKTAGYIVLEAVISLKKGNIEEEKRLFYVAITRAKKRLYLSWHQGIGNQRYAPSRFLQSLDSQYIEVR